MINTVIYFFILFQLSLVSYHDIKTKKISNAWIIINLVLYLLFLWAFPMTYKFSISGLSYSLSFLVVGFILFLLRIMGAGDSKYLSSLYLLIPTEFHEHAFLSLLYSTVLIGFYLLGMNTTKNIDKIKVAIETKDIKAIKSAYGTKFSYAPVILLSWIWLGWILRDRLF